MTPSRDQVLAWDYAGLEQAATELTSAADRLHEWIGTIDSAIRRPADTGGWTGDGQRAAEERVDRDRRSFRRVADRLDDLAKAFADAHRALAYPIDELRRHVAMPPAGVTIGPDWSVTVHDPADETARNDAENLRVIIASHLDVLNGEDSALAATVTTVCDDLRLSVPTDLAVGGSSGAADASEIASGRGNPEMYARLEAATTLTPEQYAALAAGQPVDIPQGQFDYLRSFLGALDGASIEDLTTIGAGHPDPAAIRQAVADSLQIASNPGIGTTQNIDTAGEASARGGLHALPSSVRSLLEEVPVESTSGLPPMLPVGVREPAVDGYAGLVDVLAQGDPALREGTDVDRALIARAADIVGVTDTGGVLNTEHAQVDDRATAVASSMLEFAATDRTATADAIIGLPDTMPDDAYNRDSAMNALLTHSWGEQDAGARAMFDWIGADAVAGPDASAQQISAAVRAGDTAESLAHYLSDNHHALLTSAGADNQMVGQLNPGVVQSMAGAMTPYLGTFVGAPDEWTGVRDVSMYTREDGLGEVFGVLNSDPDAARIINTGAAEMTDRFAYEFGADPDSRFATAWGERTGLLQGAMLEGALLHQELSRANEFGEKIDIYEIKSLSIDGSAGALSAVPGAGTLFAAGAPVAEYLNNPTPNPLETKGDPGAVDLYQEMTSEQRRLERMLVGLYQSHPEIANDPELGPLLTNPEGLERSRYQDFRSGIKDWMSEHNIPYAGFDLSLINGEKEK